MINAEDLSLLFLVVGVRGSGKTLLMTHFEEEHLARAWAIMAKRRLRKNDLLYPRKKINVWSNYPTSFLWKPPGCSHPAIRLEPQPLDIEKLITWHPSFQNGVIFFDEIDQIADRQDWMSTVQKLLTAGIQVMRHRNLTFFASIQSLNWLNARLQWQADVIIKMRDVAFTGWGRDNGMKPGEMANTVWIDKSGIMTGFSYEETGIVYPLQFFGKRYWGNYKTQHEFNIFNYKRKYKLNMETKEITESSVVEAEQNNLNAVGQAIEYFQYNSPEGKVKSPEFWQIASGFGFNGDKITWGKYLYSIGVTGSKYQGITRYDFSKINLNKEPAQ